MAIFVSGGAGRQSAPPAALVYSPALSPNSQRHEHDPYKQSRDNACKGGAAPFHGHQPASGQPRSSEAAG